MKPPPRESIVATNEFLDVPRTGYTLLLPDRYRLYLSCEHAQGGPSVGSPPHAVEVYDGLMDSNDSGVGPPSRKIHWDSGDQYYPPQPFWVVTY